MSEPRLLIVNADDFGLTAGVCTAIMRAHREGIVTSTSVLANGPALPAAVSELCDSGLGVGAHLSAIGHLPPLLLAREIPTLVNRRGRLYESWRRFLPRVAAHLVDPEDLRREFDAQLDALGDLGLELTHVDTHQNLHLWPSVAKVIISSARDKAIHGIRVTCSRGISPVALGVRAFSNRLRHRVAHAELATTDAHAGFDEAGRLDRDRAAATIARLGASGTGSVELACHPGLAGDGDLAQLGWGYHWPDELDALVDPTVRGVVDRQGFILGTFADLPRHLVREPRR